MEFFQENIQLREVFVQLAAFVIVFWTLKAFAWKPILKVLEERKRRIEEGQREIQAAKESLEASKQAYERRIAKIEEEARLKIQEAVNEGKRIGQEIREQARSEANQILVKARANIDLEVAKAQVELRRRVVDLTLLATEHILEEKLDETKNRELVDDFLADLTEEIER